MCIRDSTYLLSYFLITTPLPVAHLTMVRVNASLCAWSRVSNELVCDPSVCPWKSESVVGAAGVVAAAAVDLAARVHVLVVVITNPETGLSYAVGLRSQCESQRLVHASCHVWTLQTDRQT